MKCKVLTLLLITVLGPHVLSSCQKVPTGCIPIGETDAGKTISVKRGQTLCFSLPATPGTGYMWYPEFQIGALETVGKTRFESSAPVGMPGLKEAQTFQFRAKNTGQTAIRFKYARPQRTVKTVTFNLEVE